MSETELAIKDEDRHILSFYNDEKHRQERKVSTTGEVPTDYQFHSFQLCISGHRWAVPTTFKMTKVEAVLRMKKPGEFDFEEILRTESIRDVINPNFIERVTFRPWTMENSQSVAKHTFLRMDVLVNSKLYFSVQFPLNVLLHDRKFMAKLVPYVHPYMTRKKVFGEGEVYLNVVRGSAVSAAIDTYKIQFHTKISGGLWSKLREVNVKMAISVTAERGEWSRAYISTPLRKPIYGLKSSSFPAVTLSRSELTGCNDNNPIRIELYGVRRSGSLLLLGFSQFNLSDLTIRKSLDWAQTEYSYVSPNVQVEVLSGSSSRSEFQIVFGKRQVAQTVLAKTLKDGGTLGSQMSIGSAMSRMIIGRRSRISNEPVVSSEANLEGFPQETHSFQSLSTISLSQSQSQTTYERSKPTVRFPEDFDSYDEEGDWNDEMMIMEQQYSSTTVHDHHSLTYN